MLSSTGLRSAGLLALLLVAALAALASLAWGQTRMPFETVIEALIAYDDTVVEHIIVQANRLNRVVLALLVGTSLGIAGALMQAMSRNALAAPELFGVNAGAVFFVALAFTFFSLTRIEHYIWIAFFGSAVAGSLVYLIGLKGRGGLSPVRIVLAGAAISALFVALTQALLIMNRESLEGILYWLGGSVAGRSIASTQPFLPVYAAAIALTALMVRPINLLMLDDDVARGLGQNLLRTRILAGLIVVVLAGGSVALAGMIGFIGLVIPHMARSLFGRDHRWVLPASAMLGATLLLVADTASRFIVPPQEVPVGALTALIGAPFFIHVVRKRSLSL